MEVKVPWTGVGSGTVALLSSIMMLEGCLGSDPTPGVCDDPPNDVMMFTGTVPYISSSLVTDFVPAVELTASAVAGVCWRDESIPSSSLLPLVADVVPLKSVCEGLGFETALSEVEKVLVICGNGKGTRVTAPECSSLSVEVRI